MPQFAEKHFAEGNYTEAIKAYQESQSTALPYINHKDIKEKIRLSRFKIKTAQYSEVRNFSEGLAAVKSAKGKFGFVDSLGVLKIGLDYDVVSDFSNDIAEVKKGRKKFMIDKSGKTVNTQ